MLGLISRQEGKLEEAAKWCGEALDRHTRVAGSTGLAVARIKEEMAEVLRLQGRRNDAIALRRQAAEMRLAWHTNELTKYPGAGYHRGTVGELHVRRGEFAEADRDLAEACRLQPRDPRWWFIRASLQNYTGDRDGCRETYRQILQHFGGTTGGQEALAARASLLSDETPTPSDLARLAGMVGRAGADRIRPPTESLDFCNGLVELRGGRFQRAVELLTRSRERAALGPSSVATGFYLAIALHRAGRAAESAPVLAAATAEYEQLPRVEDGDVGLEVDDWLICQIARREAEALHGSAR